MALSSDLHQLTKRYVLLILLSVAVVNVSANLTGVKFYRNVVKLITVENNAMKTMKSYMEEKQNEINDIFNNSAAIEFLIKEINDIEIWWKKDITLRNGHILNKYLTNTLYSTNVNVSIGNLEEEFENGLKVANEYWMNNIDKKISSAKVKANNTYFGIDKEPKENLDNNDILKLPTPELQLEYDTKLKSIEKFTNMTKILIEIELAKVKVEDLFDNNSTIFISELINLDSYKAKVKEDSYDVMRYTEKDTRQRLNKLWKENNFEVPDRLDIGRVFITQFDNNFNLLIRIKESLSVDKIKSAYRTDGLYQ